MSIILGRPFLNTAGVVIACNKGKVTFNVDDKEHTVYFPKKINAKIGLNFFENIEAIKVGAIDCPILMHHRKYETLMIGTIAIQYEAHNCDVEIEFFVLNKFDMVARLDQPC